MEMEWIVLAALLVSGVVAAVGLGLGLRDPSTRPYKPTSAGLFQLGRTALRSEHDETRVKGKEADDGGRGPTTS
jgi:hypothetical protein